MNGYFNRQRIIALFFLLTYTTGQLVPATAWALTSGPAQPEMTSFQAAGVSDMVDVFSGDFKYNIPLLDVDGYPVNLSYQSGVGVDDEASWVGLGWNVNVGSVNRQLRGIPDDFSGDVVQNEFYTKPKKTVGGTFYVKPELKGRLMSGQVSLGVFNDNYTGIGASVGANAGLSIGLLNAGNGTAGLGLNAGLGISSSTQSGVDVTPSASLSLSTKVSDNVSTGIGLSTTLGYNTRTGLKNLTLSQSFSFTSSDKDGRRGSYDLDLGGSSYTFNTDPFYPKPQVTYKTSSISFTPSAGPGVFAGFVGVGGTGYANVREVKDKQQNKPAYGFLYAERGKSNPEALMDFTREKDNPVIPELPNLAVPVHTPDLFSFSSQTGSGQFRLYRGGTGVFFDDRAQDDNKSTSIGADFGLGAIFHAGVSYYKQQSSSVTQKWQGGNAYMANGDFQDNSGASPEADPVYFKQVGEKTLGDEAVEASLNGDAPVAITLAGKGTKGEFRYQPAATSGNMSFSSFPVNQPIKKSKKAVRRAAISYLTAQEGARGAALDRKIASYPVLDTSFRPQASSPQPQTSFDRTRTALLGPSNYRAPNHISEFSVTDEGGKRMVYGLPVYNIRQEEYTFAVGKNPLKVEEQKNLVSYSNMTDGTTIDTKRRGTDEYYSKQVQPAYATSHLLTGILSPDYVDLKGDGITDDDRGTAIKFNYSRLAQNAKWRTPMAGEKDMASFNKALLADPEDDKGNIVYGEKEQWYLQSIETKTKVAYFILEDRSDALGVKDWRGEIDTLNKQKRLKEIRLYSKADLSKPIKKVVFNYDYALCKGVPNNALNKAQGNLESGKLTLKSVYFTYGHSAKGLNHKYEFAYHNTAPFAYLASDRWGTYKAPGSSQSFLNNEYPYTLQDRNQTDDFAAQWLLKEVKLPTGGIINVTYESDDYAYVQNKRAMKMVQPVFRKAPDGTNTTNLLDDPYIGFKLDGETVPSGDNAKRVAWFKNTFLSGSDYLFGKMYVRLDNYVKVDRPQYDFVSCYGKVKEVSAPVSGTVFVRLEPVGEGKVWVNPFSISAWQKMRTEYPKYAYPGYENRLDQADPISAVKSTVSAIFNAFKTLGELKENFYEKAKRKGFGSEFDPAKSFFRITDVGGKKLGGGSRVKRISISDNWATMSSNDGGQNGRTAVTGMEYDYTVEEGGKTISSGVASYEPSLGGEENPLRQPVPYLQKIKGALNNLFYLEQPFGESYFPAPSVGYRKVTVRNLGESGTADAQNETGWTVSEFYTAKDFPTQVRVTPMQKWENGPRSKSNLFGGTEIHELALSQGYTVYLNDMHGKPRADKVYDQKGSLISSSEYLYFSSPTGSGEWQLNNEVPIVNEQGVVQLKTIGRDIELYTDMRESEFSNYGESINIGADGIPFIWGPLVLPHWPSKSNDEYRLFRSASAVKVVQSFGMVQKVIKVQDGSTVTADNMAFDPLSGDVLVTRTQNEFKQSVYSVNIPAYWMYSRMGGAYKTLGTYLKQFRTDGNGGILDAPSFFQAGDELFSYDGRKLWVIENRAVINGAEGSLTKRVIDDKGTLVANFSGAVKVLRSGNRNLVSASAATVVCMNNPFENGKLKLVSDEELASLKVIDARATVYYENWAGERNIACATCPDGYRETGDGWCELLPKEDSTQCFSICPGSNVASEYGISGAYIRQYSYSTPVNVKSAFWGGVSCPVPTTMYSTTTTTSRQAYEEKIQKEREQLRLDTLTQKARVPDKEPQNSGGGGGDITTSASLPLGPSCDVYPYRDGGLCGRLQNVGIWFCKGSNNDKQPKDKWIGVETYVTAPTAKTYYLGYGADNGIRVYVDNNLVASLTDFSAMDNFRRWNVIPVTLGEGKNRIKIEMHNSGLYASAGVEVYDNTYQQLTSESGINVLFSTADLVYKERVYTYVINADGSITPRYYCTGGGKPDILNDLVCDRVPAGRINPYVKGFKGNWRPLHSNVFQVNRSYGNQVALAESGINSRKDGHYESFRPYWVKRNQQWDTTQSHGGRWVAATTMTLYDKYGQELENRDALGRHSSAQFGFLGNVPAAVASNARNREVFYESFEDLRFRSAHKGAYRSCDTSAISFDALADRVTATTSHTGKYSLPMQTISFNLPLHNGDHLLWNNRKEPYLAINDKGEYLYKRETGVYANGFEPRPGQVYLFSCWVKDGSPSSKTSPLSLYVGGQNIPIGWKATVEGWKLVEGRFTTPLNGPVNLTLSGSGFHIDDLRILPVDGQVKTFAYDESNFRLMAELDENNFATLYEYDDEGILNRVKKETERGIMTIKETRSTYKKKN